MERIRASLVCLAPTATVIGCANVDVELARKLSGAGAAASTRLQTEATEHPDALKKATELAIKLAAIV